MKFLNNLIQKLFPPYQPIKSGIFSYRPEENSTSFPYPMHLRIENPEHALLILNARTVLHLNQTAAEFLYHFINGTERDAILKQMSKRYQAPRETIEKDYDSLFERLTLLMTMPDLDPVSFLDFDRQDPYSGDLSAPYRLDLALTYRQDGTETNGLLAKRVDQELSTDDWKRIINQAWQNGIPHLVFTGGEPTLRDDLPELIQQAENNGQVTGLLTNGVKLADAAYTQQLLQSGIDHIMLVLHPEIPACWQALELLMPDDIFVTVHLTIKDEDTEKYQQYLERLDSINVTSISLSVIETSLQETLQKVNEIALDMGFSIVWNLPVPYSVLNPVTLELNEEESAIRAEGRGWLYVEPDGDVLKAQGLTDVLGNMLRDSWTSIWSKTG
ncbi:MAG: PqqD family peptide modification chaperone [Anaerolineaceae bacterium]|nr:PqqD family peptide modification chaperone [Anaerolineaceae bacterium]